MKCLLSKKDGPIIPCFETNHQTITEGLVLGCCDNLFGRFEPNIRQCCLLKIHNAKIWTRLSIQPVLGILNSFWAHFDNISQYNRLILSAFSYCLPHLYPIWISLHIAPQKTQYRVWCTPISVSAALDEKVWFSLNMVIIIFSFHRCSVKVYFDPNVNAFLRFGIFHTSNGW